VDALIIAGAHINAIDEAGRTPLYAAAITGHAHVVRALITAGADPLRAETVAGHTPLRGACLCGHRDVVKAMLLSSSGPALLAHEDRGNMPMRGVAADDTLLRRGEAWKAAARAASSAATAGTAAADSDGDASLSDSCRSLLRSTRDAGHHAVAELLVACRNDFPTSLISTSPTTQSPISSRSSGTSYLDSTGARDESRQAELARANSLSWLRRMTTNPTRPSSSPRDIKRSASHHVKARDFPRESRPSPWTTPRFILNLATRRDRGAGNTHRLS
jgi:ankyrin repeat protein